MGVVGSSHFLGREVHAGFHVGVREEVNKQWLVFAWLCIYICRSFLPEIITHHGIDSCLQQWIDTFSVCLEMYFLYKSPINVW